MNTTLLNNDGSVPTSPKATQTGQFAYVAVNPTSHRLQVDAAIVTDSPASDVPATVTEGTKTVTTAGTAERLTASTTKIHSVLITPLRTNTGRVYIGTIATTLAQHIVVPVILSSPDGEYLDLTNFYVDVTVNGEGVAYLALS